MGQRCGHRLARERRGAKVRRGQGLQDVLLRGGGRRVHPAVRGGAELAGERLVVLAGVLPGDSGDLRGEQAGDQAVLVGGPDPTVTAQERRAGAFLAAESEGTVDQSVHEPLETDRNLDEMSGQPGGDPVDHAGADEGLADRGRGGPAAAMGEQVGDRDRQVVVGVEQAGARRHDAVPVRVGVVGQRHVEGILQPQQRRHRVRRGRVHPDLSVPVDGHETEPWVDRGVDHVEVEFVTLGNGLPVDQARATERVDADPDTRAADRIEVDHGCQVLDIGRYVVVHGRVRSGTLGSDPRDTPQPGCEQRVRAVLDPGGHGGVSRPAVGRVVLEPAVRRWVVRRRDDDAVGEPEGLPGCAAGVVREDGVRDHRGGGGLPGRRDPGVHPVGGQYLQRAGERGCGQGVGVHTDEQRPVHLVGGSVFADRLRDRDDVVGVEGPAQRRPAVPGCSERDALGRLGGVGLVVVVGGQQRVHVDENVRWCGLTRERTHRHQAASLSRT